VRAGWATSWGHDGCRARKADTDGDAAAPDAAAAASPDAEEECARPWTEEGDRRWQPHHVALSGEERAAVGLKCKQLLDMGRCAWLQQQLPGLHRAPAAGSNKAAGGVCVRYVQYVPVQLSGENRMILASL